MFQIVLILEYYSFIYYYFEESGLRARAKQASKPTTGAGFNRAQMARNFRNRKSKVTDLLFLSALITPSALSCLTKCLNCAENCFKQLCNLQVVPQEVY